MGMYNKATTANAHNASWAVSHEEWVADDGESEVMGEALEERLN
jgi:hypothetical protein